jgi:hypothetical protein
MTVTLVTQVTVCVITETWILGAPMMNKRGDFAIGFHSGHVIVAGGLGNSNRLRI